MQVLNTPEQDPAGTEPAEHDALARFRSWRGFLFAGIAVNALFVYGMLGGMGNPGVAIWYKSLVWLPFNVIATAVYLAIMARLTQAGGVVASAMGRAFYTLLCGTLIIANWAVLLAA